MKVYKINKKEFIGAVAFGAFIVAVYITATALMSREPRLGYFMVGFIKGIVVPLVFGITRVNREREPIESIEVKEEEK